MCNNIEPTAWKEFLIIKALELKLTPTQTRVFLVRFDRDNWLKRIEDVWESSEVNSFEAFVKHSTNIYKVTKPYCPEISKGAGNFAIVRDWLLAEYNRQNNHSTQPQTNHSLRSVIQEDCDRAILQPGALIRIKAPSKMGKSSLLNNILAFANEQNYDTVHINLLQLENSKLENLDLLLRWFCIYIRDALKLSFSIDDYWSEDRGSMLSCTRYLESILLNLEQPLVLGLDEADRLLKYPNVSQDFFYLLRSWYEEANNDELWEKLRLIVVYSTEDFGSLDINQSPFNVGFPVELKPLDRQEIINLTTSYQLTFSTEEIEQIIKVLGGHPYLVDTLLSSIKKNPQQSLSELLLQAATDTGIYNSYLLQHLVNLQSSDRLTEVYLDVLNNSQPISIDTLLAHQLYRMGLIKWSSTNNTVMPSCELYRQYFLPRLILKQ